MYRIAAAKWTVHTTYMVTKNKSSSIMIIKIMILRLKIN